MRIPDPIANTTTEAYLAYKAGVLAEGDLKPKLYDPYIHLDAWLAYWAGLTTTYPVKNVGKNLFDKNTCVKGALLTDGTIDSVTYGDIRTSNYIPVTAGEKYTVSGIPGGWGVVGFYTSNKVFIDRPYSASHVYKAPDGAGYARAVCVKGDLNTCQFEKGSTATAYEPYTGEPEMLTDEEALIAYLSGVTDTYPEEFRDPADVRVAAYLKYLVSARWGRPEYPVTNEELYLSMMDAPYIPAGEPSSDIEIDDTAEAPFKDVKMYGDTSQTTYTGKNLLKYPYKDTTVTRNGITFTDNGDGIITVNGTATADTLFWLTKESWAYTTDNIVIPAGTYTISKTGQSYAAMFVTVYGKTQGQIGTFSASTSDGTFTTTEEASLTVRLKIGVGATVSGLVVRPQIEAGSTATSYEPYVGGVPAPNPDYPQAVQTVTGENVVKITGKNLFDKTNSNLLLTNVYIGSSSLGTSNGAYTAFIECSPNTTYTISKTAGARFICGTTTTLPATGVAIANRTADNTASSITLTTSSTAKYLVVFYFLSSADSGTQQAMLDSLQFEKGSTATAYEPYQGQSYEVNLGKNLFDKDTMTLSNVSANPTINSVSGYTSVYIPCEPNTTYTVQKAQETTRFFVATTEVLPAPGVQGTAISSSTGGTVKTFTTGASAKYIVVMVRSTSDTLTEAQVVAGIQIEKGSQATDFAPYFTPIELCKIGDYQDYIYKSGDKWYVHKEVGKYTFTGNEVVGKAGNTNNNSFYYASSQNVGTFGFSDIDTSSMGTGTGSTVVMPIWSSHFDKKSPYAVTTSDTAGISFNKSGSAIDCRLGFGLSSSVNTAQLLTTWLTENTPSVYYPLATPTDTEITNQALIDQLNALKNGGSYTGTTYIKVSATDPNLPGLLEVEAYKYD